MRTFQAGRHQIRSLQTGSFLSLLGGSTRFRPLRAKSRTLSKRIGVSAFDFAKTTRYCTAQPPTTIVLRRDIN